MGATATRAFVHQGDRGRLRLLDSAARPRSGRPTRRACARGLSAYATSGQRAKLSMKAIRPMPARALAAAAIVVAVAAAGAMVCHYVFRSELGVSVTIALAAASGIGWLLKQYFL